MQQPSTQGVTLVSASTPAPAASDRITQPMTVVIAAVPAMMAMLAMMPVTSAGRRSRAASVSPRMAARIGNGRKAAAAMAR